MSFKRYAAFAALLILLTGAFLWATGLVRFGSGSAGPAADTEGTAPSATLKAEVPPVVTSGPSRIDFARLEGRINQLMREQAMVGMGVGIVEDGQIRFVRGFGVTASRDGQPVTENTVFRWASLSKGVAADMVTLLAQQGKLSLTDPINRWSTSLRLPNGNEARTTVADLLSQRLGIPKHAYESWLEDGDDPRFLRSMMATLNSACSPGTCHTYQNVAYDTASEIVEKVTGVPYEQAVKENLFVPLGMNTASVSRAGLTGAASWARPHRGGRNTPPEDPSEPYYRVPAAGGVNGSTMDLTLWMRAQMGLAPQVLPPEVLAMVQAPLVATPEENGRRRKFSERTPRTFYGLGWRVMDYAGHKVVGHHGGVRGYRSMIMFDPVARSGVVVLWNSGTSRPNGLEYEVMDMLYGLPFRDWLQLGGGGETGTVPAEESENGEGAPAEGRTRPDRR